MYSKPSPKTKAVVPPEHSLLTEANLRMHTSTSPKRATAYETEEPVWATWAKSAKAYEQCYDDQDGSDDEDMNMPKNHIAFRRKASLQALNVYGGCFASGFLAMHEPLPSIPRKWSNTDAESLDLEKLASEMSLEGMSNTKMDPSKLQARAGSPRPDSDTLSQVDVREIKHERRWRWRSLGKRRRNSTK